METMSNIPSNLDRSSPEKSFYVNLREGISYFLDNIMSRDYPNDVDLQKACGMYGKNAIYKLKYRK